MHKLTLIFAAFAILFAGSSLWLYRHYAHERTVNHELCTQQITRLQNNHQAEIEELQHYILQQYNHTPDTYQSALALADNSWDRTHEQSVERKYRFLFSELNPDNTDQALLRQLLLQRDYITGLIDITGQSDKPGATEEIRQYETHLAAIDEQIGKLLPAADYQQYEMLRESAVEQHHLDEYADTVGKVAPLSSAQEKMILLAKLRHKRTYTTTLEESGFYNASLSATERAHIFRILQQALHEYKNNYLQEVKPALEEEQFILLNNYETTEFNWERERLQQRINVAH